MIPSLIAKLFEVMEKMYIPESHWLAFIKHADKESIKYLKENAQDLKYFSRDDWLGPESVGRIYKAMNNRISELQIEEFLKELF